MKKFKVGDFIVCKNTKERFWIGIVLNTFKNKHGRDEMVVTLYHLQGHYMLASCFDNKKEIRDQLDGTIFFKKYTPTKANITLFKKVLDFCLKSKYIDNLDYIVGKNLLKKYDRTRKTRNKSI